METRQLYDYYSPIELDYSITAEAKAAFMMQWWAENFRVYSGVGLKREDFRHMVLESRLLFRHGLSELMQRSAELAVPMYVVSGGISEIIQEHFETVLQNGEINNKEALSCWHTGKVFSNEFQYDAHSVVTGWKLPIVHILNKQEVIYNSNIDFKRNVLVMGDILEDITMVRHQDHTIVLKIGFLNNPTKLAHLVGDFKHNYDLVIVNDGSLHPITYLLEYLFGREADGDATFETYLEEIKGADMLREAV